MLLPFVISHELPLTDPVLKFLLILVIILSAPLLLNKLKIPHLLGLIIAGAIIGPNGLNLVLRDSSIILSGTAGLLYIMFLAGLEIDMADFNHVVDVNFTGIVHCCKAAGTYMLPAHKGRIVNVSSLSALQGKAKYTAYSASKAAINGFTRALSTEWCAQGINVNVLSPGLVVTDINRATVMANPDGYRRRIEAIPPVLDPDLRNSLIEMLTIQLADNQKACWVDDKLQNIFKKRTPGTPAVRAQYTFYDWLNKTNN